MRIDLSSEVRTSESMSPGKAGSRPSEPTAASNREAAELSSQDLSAAALTAAVAQFPELRQEKVAALAEQVRSGRYELSAQKTAEAMLAQMRAA